MTFFRIVALVAVASAATVRFKPPTPYKAVKELASEGATEKRRLEKFEALTKQMVGKISSSRFANQLVPIEPAAPVLTNASAKSARSSSARTANAYFAAPTIVDINRPYLDYLYGGDILLEDRHLTGGAGPIRQKRGAPNVLLNRWPKTQPIGFVFDSSISTATANQIRTAVAMMSPNICLDFEENGAGTKLQFFAGDGCYSSLGYYPPTASNDLQQISIGSGCDGIATISHEITHALGLDHTQTRKDRNSYVTVNASAIQSGMETNFAMLTDAENNNFGVPYDYGSAMHYSAYSFSVDGGVVLEPADDQYMYTMGQRRAFSFADYKLINMLYNCSESCPTQMQCQNGGYPHPRDCSKCACPDFYTGSTCETPVKQVLLTAASPTTVTNFTQAFDQTLYSSGQLSNWTMFQHDGPMIIQAPAGRKIQVSIDQMYTAYGQLKCYVACPYSGIEIIDNAANDFTTGGKLFCCDAEDTGKVFQSQTNIIGYRAFIAPGMPIVTGVTFSLV